MASDLAESSPPSQTPPEIVDTIIDHLTSDLRTLRKCCLVARAWLPRSRCQLFRHLLIPATNLRSFLKRCEEFGPAARSLAFQALDSRLHRSATALLCKKMTSGAFLSYVDLTSLEIIGMHFPTSSHLTQLISVFPRLENVLLLDVTWIESAVQPPTGNFIFLRSLSISLRSDSTFASPVQPLLNWFASHDLPALESVGIMPLHGTANARLLAFLARLPALKHVEIGLIPPHAEDLVSVICARHSMALHSTVRLTDGKISSWAFRRLIPGTIAHRIEMQQLSHTSILCHIPHYTLELDWEGLDEVFSRRRRLPAFARVVILIEGWSHLELTQEEVYRKLPRSARRGYFRCRSFVNRYLPRGDTRSGMIHIQFGSLVMQ